MNAPFASSDRLLEDGNGLFRLDRRAFTDQEIFDREMRLIFERQWIYLCHENQVAREGDFYSTQMGRQPVYVIRGKDGAVNAFLNACSHRGAMLTPMRRGNARVLTCRFHGWCFDTAGRCVKVKNEKIGWPEGLDRTRYGLTPVARVENYKGFIFGSLSDDVPPLTEVLGAARPFIDLLADQSPQGMEIVRGGQTYLIRGNWKLQAENGVDGYHVSTVHRVFAGAIAKREAAGGADGLRKTEAGRINGTVPTGAYDLDNGHMLIWAKRENLQAAPLWASLPELQTRIAQDRLDWMVGRGRNLFVYPNAHFMDQPSTQIRIMLPIAPGLTEARVYCIAPKGESREARAARVRKFEDFYMVTGMATSDDMAALEDVQRGSAASQARWTTIDRGLSVMRVGPDDEAKTLGAEAASSSGNWENETLYYGFYRRWAKEIGSL